jgi:hypothetical protein
MVNRGLRTLFACGFFAFFLLPAQGRDLADYRLGDTVDADIITPVSLRAVDWEASDNLKTRTAERLPAILRFDTNAAAAIEATFFNTLSLTRSNFLDALENHFNQRKLDDAWLASPVFDEVVARFIAANPTLPLSTNLAGRWSRGEETVHEQAALAALLREQMRQPIADAVSLAPFKPDAPFRLVAVSNLNEEIAVESLAQRGRSVGRTNLLSPEQARNRLAGRLPTADFGLGKFLTSLLRANCLADEALTRKTRNLKTETEWVVDVYNPGQTIAKSGQKIDAKILAALKALLEKQELIQLQADVSAATRRAELSQQRDAWLLVGLGLTGAGLLGAIFFRSGGRRASQLLPARLAGSGDAATVLTCPTCQEMIVVPTDAGWQQRALAAEARAQRAHEAIRRGVLSQFSFLLRDRFFQGLIFQRRRLIENQQTAVAEIVEMQRRLDELHTPLQERLLAYEQRVAELEKALAEKGAENRELLEAKIQLVRERMESERGRMDLN